MHQTLHYHIDNRAYRFEINNIQHSLVILVQWRSIANRRKSGGIMERGMNKKNCHFDERGQGDSDGVRRNLMRPVPNMRAFLLVV